MARVPASSERSDGRRLDQGTSGVAQPRGYPKPQLPLPGKSNGCRCGRVGRTTRRGARGGRGGRRSCRARAQAADQTTAARAKALELKPAVGDAIAAISALPLGSPYKLGVHEWSYHRTEPVISDNVRSYYVYLAEEFKKPRIGKTGTVTPVGWSFSIGHYSRARLGVKVRQDRPAHLGRIHPGADGTSTGGAQPRRPLQGRRSQVGCRHLQGQQLARRRGTDRRPARHLPHRRSRTRREMPALTSAAQPGASHARSPATIAATRARRSH